jgi:hypothetical protein
VSWKLFGVKLPEAKRHNLSLINKLPGSSLYVSHSSIPRLREEQSSLFRKQHSTEQVLGLQKNVQFILLF